MGNLFQEAIRQANKAYKLTDLFPVQLSHVLMHMDEGRPFLEATETKKEKEALADAAVAVVDKAGRTCRSSIVGVLGSSVQGHLNTRRVAEITNSTFRYVQKALKQSREGDQGAFVSLQRSGFGQAQKLCPTRLDPALGACKDGTECKYLHACQMCNNGNLCAAFECEGFDQVIAETTNRRRFLKEVKVTRNHMSAAELHGTKTQMALLCPARSGDKQRIFWMTKSRDELYDEDICTVETQIAIIVYAFEAYGDELRQAAATQANRFFGMCTRL